MDLIDKSIDCIATIIVFPIVIAAFVVLKAAIFFNFEKKEQGKDE